MNEETFDRIVGFIGRWFFLVMTVASVIIALFFNRGYLVFIPFLIPITILLFREDKTKVTFTQREDEA